MFSKKSVVGSLIIPGVDGSKVIPMSSVKEMQFDMDGEMVGIVCLTGNRYVVKGMDMPKLGDFK